MRDRRSTLLKRSTVGRLSRERTRTLIGAKQTQIMLCAKGLVDAGIVKVDTESGFDSLKTQLKEIGWSDRETAFITKTNDQTYESAFEQIANKFIPQKFELSNNTTPLKDFINTFNDRVDEYREDLFEHTEGLQDKIGKLLESPQREAFLLYARGSMDKDNFCNMLSMCMNSKSLFSLDSNFENVNRFDNVARDKIHFNNMMTLIKERPVDFIATLNNNFKDKNFDAGFIEKSTKMGVLNKFGLSVESWKNVATENLQGMKLRDAFVVVLKGYVPIDRQDEFAEKARNGKIDLSEIRADRRFNPFMYLKSGVETLFAGGFAAIDDLAAKKGETFSRKSKTGAAVAKGILNGFRVPISAALTIFADPVGVVESARTSIKRVSKNISTKYQKWKMKRERSEEEIKNDTATERLEKFDEAFKQLRHIQERHGESVCKDLNKFISSNLKNFVEAKLLDTTRLVDDMKNFSEKEKDVFLELLASKSFGDHVGDVDLSAKEMQIIFKHMHEKIQDKATRQDLVDKLGSKFELLEKIDEAMSTRKMRRAIKGVGKSKVPGLNLASIKERFKKSPDQSSDSPSSGQSSTGVTDTMSSTGTMLSSMGVSSSSLTESSGKDQAFSQEEESSDDVYIIPGEGEDITEDIMVDASEDLEDERTVLWEDEDYAEEEDSEEELEEKLINTRDDEGNDPSYASEQSHEDEQEEPESSTGYSI